MVVGEPLELIINYFFYFGFLRIDLVPSLVLSVSYSRCLSLSRAFSFVGDYLLF